MTTFSGTYYNFQAEGEFIVAKSTKAGNSFQVQARMQPLSPGASVSLTTMVSAQVGKDRVTFAGGRANPVWIDGAPSTLSSVNTVINLDGGQLVQIAPGDYRITWNTGEVMTVNGSSYWNFQIALGPNDGPGSVEGILGENEGTAKDFQLADGTVLTAPLTTDQLYGEFADAWRVTQATSLMDYLTGQTTDTFTDKNFPGDAGLTLADLPQSVVDAAKAKAMAAGITNPDLIDAAALDFIVTGDPGIITADANVTTTPTTAATITPSAPPPPVIGVIATQESVVESATGTTPVTFSVYLSNAATADTLVDYTVVAPKSGFLDATTFGGTFHTGELTIAAGQTTGQFTIQVPNGALGSEPSENLGVQISTPSGDFVVGANAQTLVVNDQPVAGTAAVPLLGNLTNFGTLTQNGTAYTLDLGTLVQGQSLSAQLGIFNTAAAPADELAGVFKRNSGGGFTLTGGLLNAVDPGSHTAVSFDAGTVAVGSHTETFTFSPTEYNISGYTADLPKETLTIIDTVEAPAQATLNSSANITLAEVRVGGSDTQAISVTNSATAPAAGLDVSAGTIDGGLLTSGSISQLAAGATDDSSFLVGVDSSTGGQKSGIITLDFASDTGTNTSPLASQNITVFGKVFREATASLSAPIVHVGDAGSEKINVTNSAAADGFSEGLRTSLVSSSGNISVAGSSTGLIAAGASDSSTYTATFSTASAGIETGNVTLDLHSDGTGVDSFGNTDLGNSSLPLTVTVDNYAVAAFQNLSSFGTLTNVGDAYTLALGKVTEGAPITLQLGVLNAAQGPAADLLSGSFDAADASGVFDNTGLTAFSGITFGQDDIASITVQDAGSGSFSETITLHSTGSNASGYSGALADETLTITGTTENAAAATINSGNPIDLGNVRQGTGPTTTLSVTNTGTPPAESLDASIAATTGDATASGSFTGLALNATDSSSLVVGLDTATAGAETGTVQLQFQSQNGSGETATLPSQTVTVEGTVFRVAAGTATPAQTIVHVGDAGTDALVISNTDAADGFSEGLRAKATGASGDLTSASGTTGLIAAGASDSSSLSVSFSTATAGVLSGSVDVDITSDGTGTSGLGLDSLGTAVLPITITVNNHAKAALQDLSGIGSLSNSGTAYTLDLGSVAEGSTPLSVSIGVLNAAVGPADLLSGSFGVTGSSAFTNGNIGSFSGLGAGNEYDPTISLSTNAAGSFTETITLHSTGSNSSGFSEALADETLTVTGTVMGTLSGAEVLSAAVAGIALPSTTTVATFTDNSTSDTAAGFTATIAWGDGTTTTGAVTGSNGSFSVSGGHTYAASGSDPLSVTITRTADNSQLVVSGTVAVAAGDSFTPTAVTINTNPNVAFSGTVATFADSYTGQVASGLTAMIDWGDGTTTAGTVSGSNGAFSVSGTHTYTTAGTDAVKVTLSDTAGTSATANSTAYVGGVLTGQEVLVTATQGTALAASTTVATFTDSNPLDTATGFTTTIAWGDGTTTAGTIVATTTGFAVEGGHTYAEDGSEPVKVTVTRTADSSSASFSGTVAVADANVFTPTAVIITADQNVAFSGTVATFADSYLGEAASDLIATINWGDGTTTAGTISGSSGAFTVTGGHTYMAAGTDAVTVTLTDASGNASAVAHSSATVQTPAQAVVTPVSPIKFGNLRAGSSASQFITVTNSATAPGQTLDVTSVTTTGGITATGTIAPLAPGASDNSDLSVSLSNAAGAQSGSVTLDFASDDGLGSVVALPSQTISVEGNFFREATASVGSLATPLIVHVGDSVAQALSIINSASTDGFSENLITKVTGTSGGITTTTSSTGDIAAGASSSLTVGFATAMAGTVSGSLSLEFDSDGTGIDGAGPTSIGTQTVLVSATVDNYAVAALSQLSGGGNLTKSGSVYTLDLGSITEGSPSQTLAFDIRNAATGPADLLSGSLAATSSNAANFINSGLGTISSLAAGQSSGPLDVTVVATALGSFTETITFNGTGSNASGYSSSLGSETLTIEGSVVAPSGEVFNMTSGSDTFTGGSANNTVIATAGTINAGDAIDGGSGGTNQNNTLALQGPGTFDLTLPKSFTDFETISAQEGQGSYTGNGQTFASQQQSITLPGSDYLTVAINPAVINSANPTAASLTLQNFNTNDVLDVLSVSDTGASLSLKAGRGGAETLSLYSSANQLAAQITLFGQYTAAAFAISDDGAGGTLITDAANPLGLHHA